MNRLQFPNIIALAGFMGSGKTTIGLLLAEKLNYQFIDADQKIVEHVGMSIADYFTKFGETAFRKVESEILAAVLKNDRVVIALGGGTILAKKNRDLLKKKTYSIFLMASPEVVANRLAQDSTRPLLNDKNKLEEITKILQSRLPYYCQMDTAIDTNHINFQTIVENILEDFEHKIRFYQVQLGARSYPIYFSHQSLVALPECLKKLKKQPSKLVVVTNHRVKKLYLAKLLKILKPHYVVACISIADGEQHKNLQTATKIYDQLVKLGVDRKAMLLALGGGVVGDITGFVAGTYLRGIDFVQIPTTLLAQVDSSVGGKTGVDLKSGKNLVGVFHQPKMVFIDTHFLTSLPKRELLCGMAEIIKTAAIQDANLFEKINHLRETVLAGRYELLKTVVQRCCEIKAHIVEQDELEISGLRALLNFGHTMGHAIEAATRYGKYLHGEAVAIGMVFAAQLSVKKGFLVKEQADALQNLIANYGLPVTMPKIPAKKLLQIIKADKKRVSEFINFVYLRKIGEAVVEKTRFSELG